MNAPDPKANTTTEAYLAYKAGYLEESELKPVLYEPYLHFDAWLAYWAGLTNEYPLDKNGDPEMLTDEEALVAYLAGVTGTYPEEIKDPYDVRIVGYLKHLASIRWPEPDYPVNNEEFYLSTMEPTHTSNPVPSSDIELDTAEGKIISVEAYGDTYQQTYSGKNLANNYNLAFDYSNVASNYIQLSTLPTGIRFKTTYHTTTGSPAITFKLPVDLSTYAGKIVRLRAVFGKKGEISIARSNDDGSVRQTMVFSMTSGATISYTVPDDVSDAKWLCLRFRIIYPGNEDYTVDFTDLVMTIDNADMNYEPYTGGIPAPNPDYPQPIQVVTGEQTVTVTGKNLINIPNFTSSQHGITAEGSNQTIELTGTAGNTYFPDFRFYKNGTYGSRAYRSTVNQIDSSKGFFTEPNSEYKLSIFVEGNTPYAIVEGFETKITNNLGLVGNQVITINDSERLNFVSISISQNVTANIKVRIQLEKGTATTYEPYQGQSYTVDLGATELCKIGDYQDYIYKSGDDWYVHKSIKKMIFDGSSDENWDNLANTKLFRIRVSDLLGQDDGTVLGPILSNYYTPTAYNNLSSAQSIVDYGVALRATVSSGVGIKNIDVADVAGFKTWLSNNNTIVYAPFATPTDTKITDATLVGQLDTLAGADTYNEKTYIKVTATDPNLPALLKVEAYKY